MTPNPPRAGDEALANEIATTHLLADAARRATAPYFRSRALKDENKAASGFDPVTEADRAAERAMRAILAERHPRDGILGEEFGAAEGASGRLWVLDPIDGTRAFMAGLPCWGVLIALYDGARNRPVLGALDQPYLEERFLGLSGAGGARLLSRSGEAPLRVRACADLASATLFTTDPALFAGGAELEAFRNVSSRARLSRYGTDCYGYAMVAAGHGDLVIEAGLNPYDIQALIPIVEGAGGVVTDWSGGAAHWGGQVIVAGDRRVHEEALALLAPAARLTPRPSF